MSKRPGIILTSQFSLPGKKSDGRFIGKGVTFSSYIDYIKRKEALVSKKQLSLSEQKELEVVQKYISKDIREVEAKTLVKIIKEVGVDSQDFSKYIAYMTREKALNNKDELIGIEKKESKVITAKKNEIINKYDQLELEGKGEVISRRTNDEEIVGVYSIEHQIVTGKEIKKIRTIIDEAEKNGSVMWQDVISFDNNFLEEHGLYDSGTKELNEGKLKIASRTMMDQFIKKEQLNEPYWFASIHRNTDNIHIHFSTVEQKPSRKIQEYKGEMQPRGKRKQSTIDTMKSSFGNQLLSNIEFYKDLAESRKKSTQFFKKLTEVSDNDLELATIIEELDERLPEKWEQKVLMNHVTFKYLDKETKELVNKGVNILKEENPELKENIESYHNTLNNINDKLEAAFGKKENPNSSLKEKREKDFEERMGNAFLKHVGMKKRNRFKGTKVNEARDKIKKYRDKNKEFDKKMTVYLAQPKTDSNYLKYTSLDKLIWKMKEKEKRKLEKEFKDIVYEEKREALSSYEQMMWDVEQAKRKQNNLYL